MAIGTQKNHRVQALKFSSPIAVVLVVNVEVAVGGRGVAPRAFSVIPRFDGGSDLLPVGGLKMFGVKSVPGCFVHRICRPEKIEILD
jgi:hypothetical protein